MGQFVRFALLIILALIGFGTGICGLIGLGGTLVGGLSGGTPDPYSGVIVVLALVLVAIAAGCFFAVRALARSLRTHTSPAERPPSPADAVPPSDAASPPAAPPPPAASPPAP